MTEWYTRDQPFYVKLSTMASNENTSKTCPLNHWKYTLLLMLYQEERNIKKLKRMSTLWVTIQVIQKNGLENLMEIESKAWHTKS